MVYGTGKHGYLGIALQRVIFLHKTQNKQNGLSHFLKINRLDVSDPFWI